MLCAQTRPAAHSAFLSNRCLRNGQAVAAVVSSQRISSWQPGNGQGDGMMSKTVVVQYNVEKLPARKVESVVSDAFCV